MFFGSAEVVGVYRLRLCLWLRFLWWCLRHNYWLWFLLEYRWWGLSRSGSRLRGFLNYRLWIRWTCWLYLSGYERWRLSRSESSLGAFLNFRLWICSTSWLYLVPKWLWDMEKKVVMLFSQQVERTNKVEPQAAGSICNAKLCYINECEFCFLAFTYFMVL